jgi:hypothetical protein
MPACHCPLQSDDWLLGLSQTTFGDQQWRPTQIGPQPGAS